MRNKIPLFLLCLLLPMSAVEGAAAWFLYDKNNGHHREYVQASSRLLRAELPSLELRNIGQDDGLESEGNPVTRTLLITVGLEAARRAATMGLPTLSTLISRRNFESLRGRYRAPVSAIYLDQPAYRYLELIKSALPGQRRLMVLQGNHSRELGEELVRLSARHGLEVQLVNIEEVGKIETLFLRRLKRGIPLLLLPDHEVVSQQTIKPLVLGSYRYGIPLVAYTQSLVKAGALMAVHPSMSGMERQLAQLSLAFLLEGALPEPRYTDEFAVSVNYQLARALRLMLPSEQKIRQAMEEHSR